MPSKKSNHYGTLAEREAAERYDLEFERGYWLDARRPDGTAVEIKATMREHADGQPGNFKIYEKAHRSLRRADGCYVFVVYRIRGTGIQVLRTKYVHSSQIPRLSWHGGGDHRDTRQAKLKVGRVF